MTTSTYYNDIFDHNERVIDEAAAERRQAYEEVSVHLTGVIGLAEATKCSAKLMEYWSDECAVYTKDDGALYFMQNWMITYRAGMWFFEDLDENSELTIYVDLLTGLQVTEGMA